MSKIYDNKLVPKLRFPDFKNDEAWLADEVGNVFEVTRGYVLSMTLVSEEQNDSNPFPVYSSQTKNNGLAGYYKEFLYEDSITWTTDGANAGDVNFRKGKFYCTNVCGVLLNKNGFANLCIAALIDSVSRKHVSYVGNPKLMNGVMSKIKIPFPKIKEQQKIASCLSSLDEVITAESQKLDILYDHKMGLMQNLIPQVGETVPKFRFKEFEDSGEWEKMNLIQISTFVNDKTPIENLSIYSYISTENLLPDYRGVTLSSKLPNSGNCTTYRKGDVLISNIRPYLKKVWFADKEGACSNDVIVIRANSFVSDAFLSFLLKNNAFINYIMKGSEGVKMPRGNKDLIREYPITFSKDKTEQKKIAGTLSSLDELINAQSQKIEALKLHKKGLLQGLLPNVETGHALSLQ